MAKKVYLIDCGESRWAFTNAKKVWEHLECWDDPLINGNWSYAKLTASLRKSSSVNLYRDGGNFVDVEVLELN